MSYRKDALSVFDFASSSLPLTESRYCKERKSKKENLYFHVLVKAKFLKATEKAYRIKYYDKNENIAFTMWIPKSICRRVNKSTGYFYVHEETFSNILREYRSGDGV